MQNLCPNPSVKAILYFGSQLPDPEEKKNLLNYFLKNTMWRQDDKDKTTLLKLDLIDPLQLILTEFSTGSVPPSEQGNYAHFIVEPPTGPNPLSSLSSASSHAAENSLAKRSSRYKKSLQSVALVPVVGQTCPERRVYRMEKTKHYPSSPSLDEMFSNIGETASQTERPLRLQERKAQNLNIPSPRSPIAKKQRFYYWENKSRKSLK